MWKNWLIFILGIFLILIPFFGIPLSFARATYVILGLIIAITSFFAARDLHLITLHLNSLPNQPESNNENFVMDSTSGIVDTDVAEAKSGQGVM